MAATADPWVGLGGRSTSTARWPRNLHPSAALVIVLVAVAVGWFLPLLGISLVGFVVVDVLIAAVKARRSAKSS